MRSEVARIKGVSARETGPLVRIGYRFARRQIARLSGREPERMIEPVEMYAHVPGLLRGYARLEQATARLHRVDDRLKVLAELKAATLTHCEYCIDLGSQIARRCGLSDEQLLALPSYRTSALFTDVEKLVLDYAVGMSRTPVEVSDALVAELRRHFDDAQLVELTHLIALENMRGRFNLALGVGAAGFSDGMMSGPAPRFRHHGRQTPTRAAAGLPDLRAQHPEQPGKQGQHQPDRERRAHPDPLPAVGRGGAQQRFHGHAEIQSPGGGTQPVDGTAQRGPERRRQDVEHDRQGRVGQQHAERHPHDHVDELEHQRVADGRGGHVHVANGGPRRSATVRADGRGRCWTGSASASGRWRSRCGKPSPMPRSVPSCS